MSEAIAKEVLQDPSQRMEALGIDLDATAGFFYRQALHRHGMPFSANPYDGAVGKAEAAEAYRKMIGVPEGK